MCPTGLMILARTCWPMAKRAGTDASRSDEPRTVAIARYVGGHYRRRHPLRRRVGPAGRRLSCRDHLFRPAKSRATAAISRSSSTAGTRPPVSSRWRGGRHRCSSAAKRPSDGAWHRLFLPRGMKHRLVDLGLDRTEAMHAAHVVNAVRGIPFRRRRKSHTDHGSRLTSSASASSSRLSVLGGLWGRTR